MPSPLDELRLSDDAKRRLYETWPAVMAACMSEQGQYMEIAFSDATAGSGRTPIDLLGGCAIGGAFRRAGCGRL
jgi:hypothetical protein